MAKLDVRTYPGWNTKEGRHSVELVMAIIGESGAMVWRLAIGLTPIGHYSPRDSNVAFLYNVDPSGFCDMGIAAHSELTIENSSDSDNHITDNCEFLSGRACCCDYSTAITDKLAGVFACEGFVGVERELTKRYINHYGREP